eukprot:TRINITY_DN349_c0_g1_i2.p1 TRINITY_DN349_c0_g1~~TRINITY_DN349_c0_g1_i2.p1  ORF type:complete len:556 (-),score=65.63 TRINITY_DN349_c0_g1_i2:105-1772(-)
MGNVAHHEEDMSEYDVGDITTEDGVSGVDRMTTLEVELLYHIVSYLSPAALVSLGRTSKYFQRMLLENEDIWKRYCKESFGFCLKSDANEIYVNKLLFKSWKFHDPQNSENLAKARGYESAHIGYAGSSSPAYELYRIFKTNFRYAEEIYWFCLLDPSPVVKAYAVEGCLEFFKQKKTKFPIDSFKEMLFHLALWSVPQSECVSTLSGCCGGSERVSSIIRRRVQPELSAEQLTALDDKILECSDDDYEKNDIWMRRARLYPNDKKLHDKMKELSSKDTWYALVHLAEYRDEEDVEFFIDTIKNFIQTCLNKSKDIHNSRNRQIYTALKEFPHESFWPFLQEIHKHAISGLTTIFRPDSGQAHLYQVIVKYKKPEVVDMVSEAVDKIKLDSYDRRSFWNSLMSALVSSLKKPDTPDKHRLEDLIWKIAKKYKLLSEEAIEYMLAQRTEDTIRRLTTDILLKCDSYGDGVSERVVSILMDKLIELNHPARCDVLLEFVSNANCHNCEFLCSFIPKAGGTYAQFGNALQNLSQDTNCYVSGPAKNMLATLKKPKWFQ